MNNPVIWLNFDDKVYSAYKQKKKVKSAKKQPTKKGIEKTQTEIVWTSTESSNNMRIGKFVRTSMMELIKEDMLTESEIIKVQRADYSRQHLHIQYPLLRRALPSDPNNIPRYWAGKVKIKDNYYFICSEWYEQPTNNDRPYFVHWLRRVKMSYNN